MTAAEKTAVFELLREWGFGSVVNDQLVEHAELVLRYKGARVGEIIVALKLATKDHVDSLIKSQPTHIKTLDHLIANGVRAVSANVDRIMAIQSGFPFVYSGFPQITLHALAIKKDRSQAVIKELNKWGVLPVSCDGNLILMFDDFKKLLRFKSIGKTERLTNPLFKALADLQHERVDSVGIKVLLAKNSVLLEYQQKVSDAGSSGESGEDGIQTIHQAEADTDPAIRQLVSLLNEAIELDVNDIAIVPDTSNGSAKVYFRRYQQLINSNLVLQPSERDALTRILWSRSKANKSAGRLRHPVDGNLNFEGKLGNAFLRLSFIPLEESQAATTSVSIRVLPRTTKNVDLADLCIAPELVSELDYFVNRKSGLFIVCGPTGSGKSTTIAGMLCEHYKLFGDTQKRLSVEQPVERTLPGVMHIDVSQHHYNENERGSDTDNFGMSLRAILRHDPDVLFVGEVRDKESCMVSIDASNTGHLVFTTTHANEPVMGFRRLASFLDKERRFDLVSVLEGILAQRLVTTVCGDCCKREPVSDEQIEKLKRYGQNKGIDIGKYTLPDLVAVPSKGGCKKCVAGHNGMRPVHGLLTMNPRVRELLLSPNESDWMKAQSESDSRFTLFDGAFKLLCEGLIDFESVML